MRDTLDKDPGRTSRSDVLNLVSVPWKGKKCPRKQQKLLDKNNRETRRSGTLDSMSEENCWSKNELVLCFVVGEASFYWISSVIRRFHWARFVD
ncbi:hypothetical protein AVEN_44139-1 [Araneus ventricosus]|uniref:Uncharacterized protein n=1 Tax=Araneus ventricosus TaxID=182803 RepID=A0A4Y2DCA8_ARAVE|nr:hypothetical protein AVEN_44139-1 [Araneus ventricosus]